MKLADVYAIGLVAYLGVAFVSAFTEWGTFAAALAAMPPVLAACTGFLIATGVNWILSRRFVFKSRFDWRKELALLMLASGAVFVWNLTVFYLLYKFMLLPVMLAKIAGTCVGFLVNYGVRQFWIFSASPRHLETSPSG